MSLSKNEWSFSQLFIYQNTFYYILISLFPTPELLLSFFQCIGPVLYTFSYLPNHKKLKT